MSDWVNRASGPLLVVVILAAIALGVCGALWAVWRLWSSDHTPAAAGPGRDVPLDDLIGDVDGAQAVRAELGQYADHSAILGIDEHLVMLAGGRTIERSVGQPWHIYTDGVRDWTRCWHRVDDALTAALFDEWLMTGPGGQS